MLCVTGSHFSFTCSKSSVGMSIKINLLRGWGWEGLVGGEKNFCCYKSPKPMAPVHLKLETRMEGL